MEEFEFTCSLNLRWDRSAAYKGSIVVTISEQRYQTHFYNILGELVHHIDYRDSVASEMAYSTLKVCQLLRAVATTDVIEKTELGLPYYSAGLVDFEIFVTQQVMRHGEILLRLIALGREERYRFNYLFGWCTKEDAIQFANALEPHLIRLSDEDDPE